MPGLTAVRLHPEDSGSCSKPPTGADLVGPRWFPRPCPHGYRQCLVHSSCAAARLLDRARRGWRMNGPALCLPHTITVYNVSVTLISQIGACFAEAPCNPPRKWQVTPVRDGHVIRITTAGRVGRGSTPPSSPTGRRSVEGRRSLPPRRVFSTHPGGVYSFLHEQQEGTGEHSADRQGEVVRRR